MHAEKQRSYWTRRAVLRGAAAVAALSPLQPVLGAAELFGPRRFAYVAARSGTKSKKEEGGCIHVLSVDAFSSAHSGNGDRWTQMQCVPSRTPACLVLSPDQRTLYVANDVAEYAGLPAGTVEAFAVGVNGRLTPLGAQPMALSGTHPRAMAISPDGSLLAVAAFGGGLYSFFPIALSGQLCKPIQSYKQAGSGPHAPMQISAHPHTLLFEEQSGRLLTSDLGADCLNVFSVKEQAFTQPARRGTSAGGGPGAFVLHAQSSTLFVAHELERTIVSYRYDRERTMIAEELQRVPEAPAAAPAAHRRACVALHASGKVLYTAWANGGALTAWQVDTQSGRLTQPQTLPIPALHPSQLVTADDGSSLLVVDDRGIYRVKTDTLSGGLHAARLVVAITNACHVVLSARATVAQTVAALKS